MRLMILLFSCALALPSQEAQRPRILGIAHIALSVSDIEKSRGFYRDFLGFSEPFSLRAPDGSLERTFMKVNDQQYVELFPGLDPASDRLRQIALRTDDAEALRRHLASRGVKVPAKVHKTPTGDTAFRVTDPEGHIVEFVQYEPEGWAMRAEGKYMSGPRVSERILHLGIHVGDVEAAMNFYRDILGFKETWRGSSTGKVLSWINLTVPDGDEYLEFMLYQKPPAPDRLGGHHHICLETPDLEATLALLEASPHRKNYSRALEPRVGTNRRRLSNLYDPDGTRSELMEPVTIDGSPTPPSTAPPPVRSPTAAAARQ